MVGRRWKTVLEESRYVKRISHTCNFLVLVHYSVSMPCLDAKYSLAENKRQLEFCISSEKDANLSGNYNPLITEWLLLFHWKVDGRVFIQLHALFVHYIRYRNAQDYKYTAFTWLQPFVIFVLINMSKICYLTSWFNTKIKLKKWGLSELCIN